MEDKEINEQPENDSLIDLLGVRAKELMEIGGYDSILILATKRDRNNKASRIHSIDEGNWYANMGAAKHWLNTNGQVDIHYDNEDLNG